MYPDGAKIYKKTPNQCDCHIRKVALSYNWFVTDLYQLVQVFMNHACGRQKINKNY